MMDVKILGVCCHIGFSMISVEHSNGCMNIRRFLDLSLRERLLSIKCERHCLALNMQPSPLFSSSHY